MLQQITDLVYQQEEAVMQHPDKTVAIYLNGRDAALEGQLTANNIEESESTHFTPDEVTILHRFILSSSFISAWYDLAGDKKNRDTAAHSCSILISSFGLDHKEVFQRFLQYEEIWRVTMKSEGITHFRFGSIVWIIAIVIIGIILIIIFTR